MAKQKKDIAVIGIGKFGEAIVFELINLKRFVLAIDADETKLKRISRHTNTIVADGSDIEGLKYLGLDKFKTVVVAASDNIEIVASLIELGVNHIIAKARSISHERVLKQIGVDVIVRPESEAGIRTALVATNANFIKFSESLQEVGDGYAIGSTIVNDEKWLNIPFKSLGLGKLGVSAVSIKRKNKILLVNGDLELEKGDILMIIGKFDNITNVFGELNDEEATQEVKVGSISQMLKNRGKK